MTGGAGRKTRLPQHKVRKEAVVWHLDQDASAIGLQALASRHMVF